MKKRKIETMHSSNTADIPKNIVVLVLFIAIIVSITGTWMVLDSISNSQVSTGFANRIIEANTQGNIALNIDYDQKINSTEESA